MPHLQLVSLAKARFLTDWRSAPAGSLLQVRELPETAPLASPLIVFRFDDTIAGNGTVNSVLVLEGASAGMIRSARDNQLWPAMDASELVELCIRNAGPTRVTVSEPVVGQLVMLLDDDDRYGACFMAAGYNKELAGYVCLHSRLAEYKHGSVLAQLDRSKLLRAGSAEIRELRN